MEAKPNIVKRRKQKEPTVTQEKPRRPAAVKRERNVRREVELVASGPFAMGPATIKRSGTRSHGGTSVIIKDENANYGNSDSSGDEEGMTEETQDQQEDYYLFQLPLPNDPSNKKNSTVTPDKEPVKELGRLGSYRLFKSGRMELEINGFLFISNVNAAASKKPHTVVSIEKETNSMTVYGNAKRLVTYPEIP